MSARLILGTANFGLTYGIANKRMFSEGEAFAILEKAVEAHVTGVDTAQGYGEAEKILGRFFRMHGKVFDVTTKLPDREYLSVVDVESQIEKSLVHLGLGRIDTLLVHSSSTFERHGDVLLTALERCTAQGLIGTYGLSVYHPDDLRRAAEKARKAGCRIGAAQLPLNLFDQRFLKDAHLAQFRSAGITLYGRSLFLQGLFFMDSKRLPGHLRQAAPKIESLKHLAKLHDTSIEALALLFARSSGVDYVVVGVDSVAQLERNAALMAAGGDLLPELKASFDALEIYDEEIILPYRWKQ
ncbi:MAG TPA: aldo/keto reductase [Syntrophorhabdales bacterium]|nr:aldo/keto reductase [Syntrophorhabdales bacterium]